MSNNRVVIELFVDDKGTARIKQFAGESEANFKRVEQAGTRSAANLTAGWQRMAAALGPAISAYFSVQAVKDVLMLADSYTLLDSRLGLITESSGELAAVQGELFRISQETGTAYGTNAAVVAKLGLAMESVHASSEELLAINELVNKSLIVSGASTAEQSSFLLQFSQAMGSGVLQGEEFRAMMESNSYFGSQLAKALDTDIAGLRAMSREGKLTSDVLRSAFPKMATEIDEAFDKMPITIGRAMTMVENSFGKVINEANKASDGTSGVAQAIAEMATTLDQNKDTLGNLFTSITEGASGLVEVIKDIAIEWAGWQAVTEGNLEFWDYMNMTAAETNAWLKKNNAEGKNQSFAQLNREAKDQLEFQKRINAEMQKEKAGIGGLTEDQKKHNEEVEKELAARVKLTAEQTKLAEKIVADEKDKAEKIAAAQEEMFKETGTMADQHYAAESQKLVEKAARWKASGGEIVGIENWLYDEIGKLEAEAADRGATSASAAMDRMQGNYRSLVENITEQHTMVTDALDETGLKIKGLDGSSFTIHANLDGSGFENTIGTLIERFRELATTASTVDAQVNQGKPAGAPSDSVDWDGGMYDSYQIAADSQTGRDGNAKSRSGGKTVTTIINNNINQQLSRSDVIAIVSEQKRLEARK